MQGAEPLIWSCGVPSGIALAVSSRALCSMDSFTSRAPSVLSSWSRVREPKIGIKLVARSVHANTLGSDFLGKSLAVVRQGSFVSGMPPSESMIRCLAASLRMPVRRAISSTIPCAASVSVYPGATAAAYAKVAS
jgi:hypothetical protein